MKLLFQGDSITDVGRDRNAKDGPLGIGMGYPQLIASRLMCDYINIEVQNRGISGNRISDMYGRWIEDALTLDFDLISILCGINDIGFALRMGIGANAVKFRFIYDAMLKEVRETHPTSKIVLCEPFLFLMERELVPGNTDIVDEWEIWNGYMKERQQIVKELALKYEAIFVPSGQMFNEICQITPAAKWSYDGIHLTSAGHELLAREWLEYVEPYISQFAVKEWKGDKGYKNEYNMEWKKKSGYSQL